MNAMRRVILVLLVALLGLGGLGVVGVLGTLGYASAQSGQPVTLPAPTGPYRVGRALYDWTDHSRIDPFAPGGHTPRELSVWVWYPASPSPGATPAPYLPLAWQQAAVGQGSGLTAALNGIGHTPPRLIHAQAVADVPLSGIGQPFPVLIFAPGLGLAAYDYTTIAQDLASHGYVVVGVNPTYSTDVVLSGDRVVRHIPQAEDHANFSQLAQIWADDLRFVAGQMLALDPVPGNRFQGQLDTGHIGYFGHSLGGAAAALACSRDSRCSGAIDIDGALPDSVLQPGITEPFLFLGSGNSIPAGGTMGGQLTEELRRVPRGEGYVLTVTGARHDNFTDRGVYFNLLFPRLGVVGSINGARALAITTAYVRAFFGQYLEGVTPPLLVGPSSRFPEVRMIVPAD